MIESSEIAIPQPYRLARKDDAAAITELVNFAGEGMPVYLWGKSAGPGQTAWDIGQERARRERGAFSYRNTVVRDDAGSVSAALLGYGIDAAAEPADYDDMPSIVVPLQQLEDQAIGSWYVNVLAAYPEHRGKGYGTDLLDIAEQIARSLGYSRLSIIVSDANIGARRLYERSGYVEHAVQAKVMNEWQEDGKDWLLLIREL